MATTSMDNVERKESRLLYDSANTIYGADADTSRISRYPSQITVEDVPAATTATVQVRINSDAKWLEVTVIDNAALDGWVIFENPPNFCRVIRTGTGDFIVYDQDGA